MNPHAPYHACTYSSYNTQRHISGDAQSCQSRQQHVLYLAVTISQSLAHSGQMSKSSSQDPWFKTSLLPTLIPRSYKTTRTVSKLNQTLLNLYRKGFRKYCHQRMKTLSHNSDEMGLFTCVIVTTYTSVQKLKDQCDALSKVLVWKISRTELWAVDVGLMGSITVWICRQIPTFQWNVGIYLQVHAAPWERQISTS
jgi:hypothetical protein